MNGGGGGDCISVAMLCETYFFFVNPRLLVKVVIRFLCLAVPAYIALYLLPV